MISHLFLHQGRGSFFILAFTSSIGKCDAARVILAILIFSSLTYSFSHDSITECNLVLDAGCGEGYLSRILAHRGANVTGIDISTRLVEIGRAKDPEGQITYQVADLSQPLPAY